MMERCEGVVMVVVCMVSCGVKNVFKFIFLVLYNRMILTCDLPPDGEYYCEGT